MTETHVQKDGRPNLRRRDSNLPLRGLEDDRLSMRIPAMHDAEHTVAETHGFDHWKTNLLMFIHSKVVQTILMGLLVLDVVILFTELFLVGTYPPCHIIERDAISCCGAAEYGNATSTAEAAADHHLRFLAESEGHDDAHHNLCAYPAVESHSSEATCDPHKWSTIHSLEAVLFIITVTILSVFFVELIAMVIVLRKAFFCQFFYVLDLFIVSVSLSLEIAFAVIHEEYLMALTGILIFGRIWRFVRIGHGLIEVTAEYAAKDKKVLLDYADQLERMLQENNIALPEKSERVRSIEKHLTQHGDGSHTSGHN